jgi:hypothetical protein
VERLQGALASYAQRGIPHWFEKKLRTLNTLVGNGNGLLTHSTGMITFSKNIKSAFPVLVRQQ